VLALDEIIIAYKNSLDQTLMFGAFFQGSQDSNLLTPVTTNNCTIVYAGNANVLSLLDNDSDLLCVDINQLMQVQNYTFG
jgi:hypothetical protein